MKYRFLEFELDVDAYELRRSGQRLRLARQPMDLLLLLLSHPRELVTREDIANRLWEPGVHTDVEAGIHTGILRIRQVLGDPREAPRFVETVPGKGYRFIAPVQSVDDRDRSAPLLRTSHGIGDAWVGAIDKVDATPRSVPLSIAVLPFANIGNDATNAYFSDGLAEELITALAQVPQLRVAGRVSAFYFRDRPNELQQVGKALDVDRVLEGSNPNTIGYGAAGWARTERLAEIASGVASSQGWYWLDRHVAWAVFPGFCFEWNWTPLWSSNEANPIVMDLLF